MPESTRKVKSIENNWREVSVEHRFLILTLLPLLLCLLLPKLPSAAANMLFNVEGSGAMRHQSNSIPKSEKAIELAQANQAVYFTDDFDGSALKEHWEVLNEDKDAYIVEGGNLLIISSKPGSVGSENIVNMLRLKKPMPKGDWIMTAKLNVDYQTFGESLILGLYENSENYIVGDDYIWTNNIYSEAAVTVGAYKLSKGHLSKFSKNLSYIKNDEWPDKGPLVTWARSLAQPQYLRLEKKGRNYIVSAKLENGGWVELEKLTALQAEGNLIIGFTQNGENVGGESTIRIDWVKIETPELPT